MNRFLIKIFFISFYFVNSQEIPNEFFLFIKQKINFDSRKNWKNLTTLGSPRYQDLKIDKNYKKDSLYIKTRYGLFKKGNNIALYGYGNFIYQEYLYGYLYPRIVNNPEGFKRYSGIPRDISRNGFSSGETDLSGIGFQNNWLTFQLGRGRESWGAGNNIQLALSENAPSYDYIMLGSNYGKIRVKYIHGFLESNIEKINRYITARGLEWTNRENLVIGISETVIYSGLNRPIDFGYLNPISTHLEIELNNRLNVIGDGNSNAVWQISLDTRLLKNKLRLSLNFLIDEFVIDKIQIDQGKEHGKAYSFRSSYTILDFDKTFLSIYHHHINVGTPTFRHGDGYNNFVQRGKPLGWEFGSDGFENTMGLNLLLKDKIILDFKIRGIILGEGRILINPYKRYADYQKDIFPSGVLEKRNQLSFDFIYWWKKNISISSGLNLRKLDNKSININNYFGFDIYFPKNFII